MLRACWRTVLGTLGVFDESMRSLRNCSAHFNARYRSSGRVIDRLWFSMVCITTMTIIRVYAVFVNDPAAGPFTKTAVKWARTTLQILKAYSSTIGTHLSYTVARTWTTAVECRRRLSYSICIRHAVDLSHTIQYMHSRSSNILQRGHCVNWVFRPLEHCGVKRSQQIFSPEWWYDRLC